MKTYYVPVISKFYLIMCMVFLLGFIIGSWVFFPAEQLTSQDECVCDCPSPEVFLVEDFVVVDGFYYADVDDFRRLRCEVAE